MSVNRPVRAAVCVALGAFASSGALASERAGVVFHDVGARSGVVAPALEGPLVRQRLARADLGELGDIRARVADGASTRMILNLWDGAEFAALIERTTRTSAGYSLSGRVLGSSRGAATMVVNGDVVVGNLWTPSALYDIRTVDGVQVLREVDVAALPPLAAPRVRQYPRGKAHKVGQDRPKTTGEAVDDGSVVDLVVLWTAAAEKRAGGVANIQALIDLGVASANDAYARGGVDFRLSLVATEQTDYPDLEGYRLTWENYRRLDSHAVTLGLVRNRYRADIVSVVMLMGFGGYANLMHELSPDFADEAYNFVHVDRVAYNTLAHEVGHNMGLHHDRYVSPVGGVFPYSHGYVNQRALRPGAARDSCWATIMAYLDQCAGAGHRLAVRIPYFSNPNQRYPGADGDPLGVDEGSVFLDARGPANAVASLNKARHVVANFRVGWGDRGGATDYGDTAGEAKTVLLGSTTRGLLEADDKDYFRIDVPRGGVLRVDTTGSTDTHGELTSADGQADFAGVADDNSGEGGNFLIEAQVKPGAYLIAVRGTDGARGDYRLRASLDWLREDRHGNSAPMATRVAAPSSTDGVLGVDDVDYFRIDLDEVAVLRVETSGSVDTYGKLAWLDGRAVLEDDDSGRDQNFRIETRLPPGAYVVEVRGFSPKPSAIGFTSPATGLYTLDVWFGPDGRTDDHGDVFATATTVAVPSTTAGELEPLDADYFRIDLPSLGTMRAESVGETDTRGRLFRLGDYNFLDELVSNDDGGAARNFLIEETLGGGTYYLEVRGVRGATTGGYVVNVSFAPGEDDHGDTEEDATVVAVPIYKIGRFNAPFDVDYFRLALTETSSLDVKTSGLPTHFRSWIELRQENRIIAADDGHLAAAKLPAGVYFVAVRLAHDDLDSHYEFSTSPDAMNYVLEFRATPAVPDDHGDMHITATAVGVPSTTEAELEEPGDVDFFRVEPPAGRLRVSTSGTASTRVAFGAKADSGEGENFDIERVVSGGRHYVQVRGADEAATGRYTLAVSVEPLEPPPPDDHGDTEDTASPVPVDSTTTAVVDHGADKDVFRIEVPVAGVLRAETTGDTDTVGRLASEAGTVLAKDDNGGALLNFRIDSWVPAGAYFVVVSGWEGATGAYTLRTTFAPTETRADEHALSLVFSARHAPARESLVRIVNHSTEGGTVGIRAIDDRGAVRGPVTLAVGAGHAAHFDSHDLETGNVAKGLLSSVGVGEGDWRLRLATNLNIEPLAYARSADGFLAAMHDTVPATGLRHSVHTFNPARNRERTSLLRLINDGGDDAEVTISAVDDRGAAAPGGAVALTLAKGAAHTLTARQLEQGDPLLRGRLGAGAGKWRLLVSANRPIVVQSLVERGDGAWTNLSGRPANAGALPLLLSGYRLPASGFARIVNAGDLAGEVIIHAVDDAGRRYGPMAVPLGAGQTTHFNTADLEEGNAAKGLPGTSPPVGDWRLQLDTELDIAPLAFARGPDGFLAAMHDVAPSAGRTHRVPIFQPARMSDPASELRLVNMGETDAAITITATDDFGQPAPGGPVSLTLAAIESRTVTARELESGGEHITGSLGVGAGRWRLSVQADADIQVLNLLGGADGRWANLSTSTVPAE